MFHESGNITTRETVVRVMPATRSKGKPRGTKAQHAAKKAAAAAKHRPKTAKKATGSLKGRKPMDPAKRIRTDKLHLRTK